MRMIRKSIIAVFVLAAAWACAEYDVKIVFSNGATRNTKKLVVQNGAVVLAKENLKVPVSQVKEAVFTLDNVLSLKECDLLVKGAMYAELLSRIDSFLKPVEQGLVLKSNLDVYLQYKIRALFWTGDYEQVVELGRNLEAKGGDAAMVAKVYQVLVKLEEGAPVDEVTAACAKLNESFGAAKEFIRGRLAMEMNMYDPALQHFSNVLVYHEREPEWVSAATFYEGLIYRKTGYLESASSVADELKLAYPDGCWGQRAGELEEN